MNKYHKDAEGTPLHIGDEIVYTPYSGGGLVRGTVLGFTPKKIRCLKKGATPSRTYTDWKGNPRTILNSVNRSSYDIIKI